MTILKTNSNTMKRTMHRHPTLENSEVQIHFIPHANTLPKWSLLKCHCKIQLLIPGVDGANCLLNLVIILYRGVLLENYIAVYFQLFYLN